MLDKGELKDNKVRDHLICLYTNIDGLTALKGSELQVAIDETKPHVVLITETKLMSDMTVSQYLDCRNFSVFRKDRGQGRGGGVIILVRHDLWATEILDSTWDNIEATTCHVTIGKKSILLSCMYRPPAASEEVNDQLLLAIRKMCELPFDQLLICGDFNYRGIDWENNTVESGDTSSQAKFYEVCQDGFLHQHVREFTRVRGNDEPSLLDLVLTHDPLEVEEINHTAPVGKSDHCILTFKFMVDKGEFPTINQDKRNFQKANYTEARKLFGMIDWEQEMKDKDVEQSWNIFLQHYHDVVHKTVPPYQVHRGRVKKKWMTNKVLMLIQRKEAMWNSYRKNKCSKRKLMRYRKARNQVTTAIRQAKYVFERKLADEVRDNPRVFYAYARSCTTLREELKMVKRSDGTLTSTLGETCEVMNHEYQKVFVQSNQMPTPAITDSGRVGIVLRDVEITVDDVKRILVGLKTPSAPGPDTVNPRMLKECAELVSQPLLMIFTGSLSSGYLPKDWRRANITPIFKKGCRTDPLNYRPVSLTSVVSKVLEKLIREKIVMFLESTDYFSTNQHGFRSGKSCLTQMLEYLNDIEDIVDEGNCADAIYLDCRKAFDTVPHKHLMTKLENAGIQGHLLNWITNFLINREQRVVINGNQSTWLKVGSGVPQGSVLGPTLFLIYINDLLDNLNFKGKLFADDAKIYGRVNSVHDRAMLQDDLNKLNEWSMKWLLQFNKEKCKVMHIGKSNPGFSYDLGGSTLQKTKREKDLGVLITDDLKSADQVASAAAAANSMIWRIRKTFTCLDEHTLPALYKALVRPRMEFAVQAWSPHLRKDINQLEKVQRRATKLIPSLASLPYEARLKKLNLTTLEDRRQRGDMIEAFKILKGIDKIQDKFLELDTDPRTRGHIFKLKKLRHNTQKRMMFFNSRIVNKWNELPDWVVQATTVTAFKNRYDKFISKNSRGGSFL